MSMSSLLGDVRKKVGRKMTIHDPSSVASLVGSLTHLRVLEEDARRGRASSEPPVTVPDTHSDCSSDEKELEEDTAIEPEHDEDDESDDDEFYIAYMMEMQEGDCSFMNGELSCCCHVMLRGSLRGSGPEDLLCCTPSRVSCAVPTRPMYYINK